ncbi:hypothetical protein [Nocardioides sp.]|uniref:hypothetical protein n=1 Tax=Nocardioides sp. TaxID=35761 RepID=UPI0035698629
MSTGPAQTILDAATAATAAAETITNPLDRARALEDAAANIPRLQRDLRLARAAAIRQALETRTATAVASELGISRARLYQVLEDRGTIE